MADEVESKATTAENDVKTDESTSLKKDTDKMSICLAHYCVGDTDGVSLEMDKHKHVLEKMGHSVIYLCGIARNLDAAQGDPVCVIPALDYRTELNKKIYHNAYETNSDFKNEDELNNFIFSKATELETELIKFFSDNRIELIFVHNMFSHALHLPASIAMCNAIKKCNIRRVIGYHHDFHWERDVFEHPTSQHISTITDKYCPVIDDGSVYKHVCINSIGKQSLINKKKLDSNAVTIIPNVFDYVDGAPWIEDKFNGTLKTKLGIRKGDIVVLQATRIVKRKAIELAVNVLQHMLQIKAQYIGKQLYNGEVFDGNIHFLMPGLDQEFDREYVNYLYAMMDKSGAKVHRIPNIVGHTRVDGDNKQYSLWDTYVISDIVTYPSVQEGWGNQYLEAVYAHKPQLLFEYPVYTADIKSLGFDNIELGSEYKMKKAFDDASFELMGVDSKIIERCAKQCMDILFDKNAYETMVNHNFEIAKKHLSYQKLESILRTLL